MKLKTQENVTPPPPPPPSDPPAGSLEFEEPRGDMMGWVLGFVVGFFCGGMVLWVIFVVLWAIGMMGF